MSIHTLTFPDTGSKKYVSARYHYLLQIIFGETIAIDYCRRMAAFAPTEEAKAFLLRQQSQEDEHLEMLTEYVQMRPRPEVKVSKSLKKLDALMSEALKEQDYIACVFIQNFIVEGLNISLLREFEHHTDSALSELSTSIVKDELKHMQFGVDEIKRILSKNKDRGLVQKLIKLHRKALFYATSLSFSLVKEAESLGIPISEFGEKTVKEHMKRITEAGFPVTFVDRIFYTSVIVFFKLWEL